MAKVMVSMPDELLAEIDREASRRGMTRSGLLRQAAARELGKPDPAALDRFIALGRALMADVGPFDSGELIRQERDALDRRDMRRVSRGEVDSS